MPAHIETAGLQALENPYDGDQKGDEILPVTDEKEGLPRPDGPLSETQRQQLLARYGRKAEEDDIAPAKDVQMILDKVIAMDNEEALDVLVTAIEVHKADPNFPPWTMSKIRALIQGYKACDMSEEDWSFDIRTEAAILKYHSPYPEVRSVTDPFDDPDTPCETFRAYVLGIFFMCGSTCLNTFFSQRQPAISLSSLIMQLLVAPLGMAWAKVIPNWHIHLGKKRIAINNGPWTYKEQCFSTILFTIVNGAGSAQLLILARE